MCNEAIKIRVENYQSGNKKIFDEWKDVMEKAGGKVLVQDGIVCPETWFSQDIRPLVLLKEAYGDGSSEQKDFSLIEHLQGKTEKQVSKKTWFPVYMWTKGIFSIYKGENAPDYKECNAKTKSFEHDDFNSIAVVEVKKFNGKSQSGGSKINDWAEKYKKQLYEQIMLCDPTIIICGNTFGAFKKIFCGEHGFDPKEVVEWVYELDNKIPVVNFYHPAAICCKYAKTQDKVYELLIEHLQQYIKEKKND